MKYAPLWDYLECQAGPELELDFATIEKLIGAPLPATAEQAWWWGRVAKAEASCLPERAWRKAWPAARFDAFLIRGSQRVKFSRITAAEAAARAQPQESARTTASGRPYGAPLRHFAPGRA